MQILNLPSFNAKIKEENGKKSIFDNIRMKYVVLTPEEWVRQHFLNLMVEYLKYPKGLIAVETVVKVNNLKQRADIVLYNRNRIPVLIVECKAPGIILGQDVVTQAARYNSALGVNYIVVTNGLVSYCIKLGVKGGGHELSTELPLFELLK